MESEQLSSPPTFTFLSSHYELLAVFLTSVLPRSCIPHQHSIWVCKQSRFGLAPCTANQNPETPRLVAKNGELVSDVRPPSSAQRRRSYSKALENNVDKYLRVCLLEDKHIPKGA